jgi:hypothetical protein
MGAIKIVIILISKFAKSITLDLCDTAHTNSLQSQEKAKGCIAQDMCACLCLITRYQIQLARFMSTGLLCTKSTAKIYQIAKSAELEQVGNPEILMLTT